MAETKITIDNNMSQVRHSNPATQPLPGSAGVAITATAKTVGNPNAVVHGQVNAGSSIPGPVFDNPA
jgi:hypothetical protein